MLLATKLKNQILSQAADTGLPLAFSLQNISVNGKKRGCSGFVQNLQTGSTVYVNTEHSVYAPLADKSLYRYARDTKDYSSTSLSNGWNNFCTDNELPLQVLALLRASKGKISEKETR